MLLPYTLHPGSGVGWISVGPWQQPEDEERGEDGDRNRAMMVETDCVRCWRKNLPVNEM